MFPQNILLPFAATITICLSSENGPADIGDYPYMVSIQAPHRMVIYNITNEYIHLCDGVSLAPRLILTVAHCISHHGGVIPLDKLHVVAGDTYLQAGKKYMYTPHEVINVHFHDRYLNTNTVKNLAHDFVLLELCTSIPAEFGVMLNLTLSKEVVSNIDMTNCTTAFWGSHLRPMMFYNRYAQSHTMRQTLRASDVTLEDCPYHPDKVLQDNSLCFRRTFQENFGNRCSDNVCWDEPDRYLSSAFFAKWAMDIIEKDKERSYTGDLSAADNIERSKLIVLTVIASSLLFLI